MRFFRSALLFVFLLSFKTVSYASGADWLLSQQQENGGFSSSVTSSTPYQASVEAVATLKLLDKSPANTINTYINDANSAPVNSENLSRRILANKALGLEIQTTADLLLKNQNSNKGFGGLKGFESEVYSTSFALQALSAAGLNGMDFSVSEALAFLISAQDGKGAWAPEPNQDKLLATILVVKALIPFQYDFSDVPPTLTRAKSYIYSQRQSDSSWGDIERTASALTILALLGDSKSILEVSQSQLKQEQLANGSWGNDAYLTALSLKALHLIDNFTVNIPKGGFSGSIFRAGSDQPIENAKISIGGKSALSNQDGFFNISEIEPAEYTAVVEKPGYTTVSSVVSISPGQISLAGNVSLALSDSSTASGGSTIRAGLVQGQVYDIKNGEPLSGVRVSVGTNVTAYTDDKGQFSTSSLERSTYSVTMIKDGYIGSAGLVNVEQGQIIQLRQGLLPVGAEALSQPAKLTGKVLSKLGQELSGVTVILDDSKSISSDSTGSFSFHDVTRDNHKLVVSKTGYQPVTVNFKLPNGPESVDIGGVVLYAIQPVDVPQSLTLKAKVIHGATGLPLEGAQLTILGKSLSATSSSLGGLDISAIDTKEFSVLISKPGFATAGFDVKALGFGEVSGVFPLTPVETESQTLESSNTDPSVTTITLNTTVLNSTDNSPIEGADIKVLSQNIESTTDVEGKITISNISQKQFSLELSKEGFDTVQYDVSVNGFGVVSAQYLMNIRKTSTTVTGYVFDKESEPLSGVVVSVPEHELSVVTNAAGQYTLEGLTDLVNEVKYRRAGFKEQLREVTVSKHGDFRVDVQLEPIPVSAKAQIVSLDSQQAMWESDTQARFDVQVSNVGTIPLESVVLGVIRDANDEIVGQATAVVNSTSTPSGQVILQPSISTDFDFIWSTGRYAAGQYTLQARLIFPGSITAETPQGELIAVNETAFTIKPSLKMSGALGVNPPIVQFGSEIPTQLSAVIRNTGNSSLPAGDYQMTVKNNGTVLHTVDRAVLGLESGKLTTVSFGEWKPTQQGHLAIELRSLNVQVEGVIESTLYVGNKASGTYSVNTSVVPKGDSSVKATVTVEGADTASASSSDPLFALTKEATEKAYDFVVAENNNWLETRNCIACHTQTQAAFGIFESLKQGIGTENDARSIYNTLVTSQADDGGYIEKNRLDADVLGLWALNATSEQEKSLPSRAKAAQHIRGQKQVEGDKVYWSYGSTLWWESKENMTALATMTLADLLPQLENTDLSLLREYSYQPVSGVPEILEPTVMKVSDDGIAYIVSKKEGKLYHVNMNTKEVLKTTSHFVFYRAEGIALLSNTEAVVTTYLKEMYRVDLTNVVAPVRINAPGGHIYGEVEVSSSGDIYYADFVQRKIWILDSQGNTKGEIVHPAFDRPFGLAFDSNDVLYIGDTDGKSIYRVQNPVVGSVPELYAGALAEQPYHLEVIGDDLYATTKASGHLDQGLFKISNGYAERLVTGPVQQDFLGLASFNGKLLISQTKTNVIAELVEQPLDISGLAAGLREDIPKAVDFIMATEDWRRESNTLVALGLWSLKSTLPYVRADQVDSVQTYIEETEALLKQRQNDDGGWEYSTLSWNTDQSDPLTTAMVGLSLQGEGVTSDDPVVRRSVEYLLGSQNASGAWNNINNGLSTDFSSTSFVLVYLPKVLELFGGLDADLKLGFADNMSAKNFSLAPDATMSANGINHFEWSLKGLKSQGQTIEFDLDVAGMLPNEVRPASANAYIEFLNSFTNEVLSQSIDIPNVNAISNFTLGGVSSDQLTYQANIPVVIAPVVVNGGSSAESGSVALKLYDSSQVLVADLGTIAVNNITAGQSLTLAANWNTGTVRAGTYKVEATLSDLDNNVLAVKETSFNIDTPEQVVSTRVTTDKAIYAAWDTVRIDGRITNQAKNVSLKTSRADISVYDASNTLVHTERFSINALSPQFIFDVNSQFSFSDAIAGTYTVELQLKDDFSGQLLSTAVTNFAIQKTVAQGLRGEVTAQLATIDLGDANQCEFTTRNVAGQTTGDMSLVYAVVNVDTSTIVSEQVVSKDIGAQSSDNHSESIATSDLGEGNFSCLLQVEESGKRLSLAQALFTVVKPPIEIQSVLTQPQKARTLVLVDPEQDTCTATQSITLEGEFHQAINSESEVYAKVFGHRYFAVDAESASPASFTGTVNDNLYGDLDVSITQLDTSKIRMRISAKDVIEGAYKFYAKYPHGWWYKSLHTGTTHFRCGESLNVGDQLGQFTVTAVETVEQVIPEHYANHCPQPHHHHSHRGQETELAETPALSQQRSLLAQLLHNRSHTVVDSSNDFRTELLSGAYNQYLILAQEQNLDHSTSKLVREAVNRGEGVVYAGGSQPQHPLVETLGISIADQSRGNGHHGGYHSNHHWKGKGYGHSNHGDKNGHAQQQNENTVRSQQLRLDEHELHSAQTSTLALQRDLLHIQSDAATVTAYFENVEDDHAEQQNYGDRHYKGHDKHDRYNGRGYGHEYHNHDDYNHCPDQPTPEPAVYPAITVNAYGNGKSVYIGFDLLAEAAQLNIEQGNTDNVYSELLGSALNYTTPTQLTHYQGSVVPVELVLNNLGVATSGEVIFTLPLGTELVDSNTAVTQSEINGQSLISWSYQLAQPDSQVLTLWLKPAYLNSTAAIQADIYTGAGDKALYSSHNLLVTAETLDIEALIQQICDQLAEHAYRGNAYYHALYDIHKAHHATEREHYDSALDKLLQVTNTLKTLDSETSVAVRLSIDTLIWKIGQLIQAEPEKPRHHNPHHTPDWWSHWW